MTTISNQLHIFFFPFPGHGHMIPTIDMAKLFASRGCKISVILTHANALHFADTIERCRNLGFEIETLLIKFPYEEVGLPQGSENAHMLTKPGMVEKFFAAVALLKEPFEELLLQHRPDCLVAGAFFPWATDMAAKLGIPRLVFHGTSFFSLCVSACLTELKPHEKVIFELDTLVVPNMPHEIKLLKDQLPPYLKEESDISSLAIKVHESELTSYGVIVNSYYELEPEYADHYRRFLGRKAWHIGPLSLVNSDGEDKSQRGQKSSIAEHECLNWLNSKEPKSVVYVSFGTLANFNDKQLMEIATGLAASGKQFIWVVKKEEKKEEGVVEEEWLPHGFEESLKGKGLIIRGWAPQVMILEHEAIGGFVTHCGWNSVFEGICTGVPMVTWPVAAEQFYNEKFVTDILGIGVGVGAKKWARFEGDSVKSEALEKAVRRIMEGEEAEEMRNKAKALVGGARKAFEEGGSSYSDLGSLIEELKMRKAA